MLQNMGTDMRGQSKYFTPKEVAGELGCNVSAVYRAVERGELKAVRLMARGAIKIPRSAVEGQRP